MRQRGSQHLRLAVSAGRGRGAQVDARLLDELRDRCDPSPGACAIGAEIACDIGAVSRARPSAVPLKSAQTSAAGWTHRPGGRKRLA
jgi:hypothetical protein